MQEKVHGASIETAAPKRKAEPAEPKALSWPDWLRFVVCVLTPSVLRGSLAASRFWLPILAWLNAGAWTADTLTELRRKYKSDRFRFRVLFLIGPTLLLLQRKDMDRVLESSDTQADPPFKKKALEEFIPDAVIISDGKAWEARRAFNATVLDSDACVHRHAHGFLEVISTAVPSLSAGGSRTELRWSDFRALAQRISQQVLVGKESKGDQPRRQLAKEVDPLVARVNWHPVRILAQPRLWHPSSFSSFYHNIQEALSAALPGRCLIHDARYEDPNNAERGEQAEPKIEAHRQIAFWVFVLRDALSLHVPRTLALIAAHPEVEDKVRAELRTWKTDSAQGVDDLRYLAACIEEQLRLWSSVPVLLRRVTAKDFELPDGLRIEPEQQIMLYPGYYHRDKCVFGHVADRFSPDAVRRNFPPTYYFSQGRQTCAGKHLVLFLMKATLASLMTRFRFELLGPQLDPARLPYLYDHFHVRFRVTRLRGSGAPATTVNTGDAASACPGSSRSVQA